MRLKNINISENGLNVTFENDSKDCYPFIWLRDHAQDDENWDNRSNQRKLYTAGLDINISSNKASLSSDGDFVEVFWPDMNATVKYTGKFLAKNSLNLNSDQNNEIFPWDIENLDSSSVMIDFSILKNYDGMYKLLYNIVRFGFSVINNCPTEMKSVDYIAQKIGYVRNSIFGGLWSFESNADMADSAYTQEALRPHTDGTYSHDAPGLQLLLCCEYNAEGGESIMVDGYKIAEIIKENHSDVFSFLSEVDIPGSYVGDGVKLQAKRPVFKLNKNNEVLQVSFNNYDRSSFRLPNNEVLRFYNSIKQFDLLANTNKLQWKKILNPGQLLIFDNWRVMHGRGEFKGKRKMSGCYINREDFESACRMHGLTPKL